MMQLRAWWRTFYRYFLLLVLVLLGDFDSKSPNEVAQQTIRAHHQLSFIMEYVVVISFIMEYVVVDFIVFE
jgi:hypothetical protein